ncbi:hypothetical protein [Stakelama saccharophila]|uniref:Uncharacterized protein n=1 Tax=Stakelama saccharophila TaxID=3075605 RepID=A0ABZ0BBH0_9SPHN|nr:hypothetical protein [Stakelama sp. W311]WNO54703.1 hypothetical protein RPR59_05495 [Stakelama sp. W311]
MQPLGKIALMMSGAVAAALPIGMAIGGDISDHMRRDYAYGFDTPDPGTNRGLAERYADGGESASAQRPVERASAGDITDAAFDDDSYLDAYGRQRDEAAAMHADLARDGDGFGPDGDFDSNLRDAVYPEPYEDGADEMGDAYDAYGPADVGDGGHRHRHAGRAPGMVVVDDADGYVPPRSDPYADIRPARRARADRYRVDTPQGSVTVMTGRRSAPDGFASDFDRDDAVVDGERTAGVSSDAPAAPRPAASIAPEGRSGSGSGPAEPMDYPAFD